MQPTVERPWESMQHARGARSIVAIVATLTLAFSVTAQAQTNSSDARKGAAQSATKPASAAQSATKAASPGANPVTAAERTRAQPQRTPAARPSPRAAPSNSPRNPPRSTAETARQRQLQSEQRQLQQRLAALKQQLAQAEASQTEASDALRESEAAISATNRRLRDLAQARSQVEQQINALQERSRAAAARQSDQERQLGQILRLQLVTAQQTPWQLLLAGRAPQQAGRDAIYLDYVVREKTALIGALQERREELALLETESRDKHEELALIARDEEAQRAELLKQQTARRAALDRLARRIGEQRQSIASLERDDRRLATLIDELARVLAEQARARELREERERRERQEREAQAAVAPAPRTERRPAPAAPPPAATAAPDMPTTGQFAQLRGKLQLPVKGEVTATFGSPRRTEAGVNAPTWKGVFIRAKAGQDVLAVAAGRVVFADWLRGFGNLAIVDHGEGFLSVYGNNESLLASVGAQVAAGEPIATVGSTGGISDSGLYFELRFQGRPFDPLRWVAAR